MAILGGLEARLFIKGRMHQVGSFVYYFPECFLVIKVGSYGGERVKDVSGFEFQVKTPGADFRTVPVRGIRYE